MGGKLKEPGWTTADEMLFIDQLARHRYANRAIEKLEGYLRGMQKRVIHPNKTTIEFATVIDYARKRIEQLRNPSLIEE